MNTKTRQHSERAYREVHQTGETSLSCSVVIAAFRPGFLIDQCLAAILAQQGIADLQVIVVDSSADGTAERLKQTFPTIEVVALECQTPPSIARSLGVARARAEFVAVTDHDCLVPPDWLMRLLTRHQEGEYAVVGGAVDNGTPWSMVGTASYLMEFNEFLPIGPPRLVATVPYCNVCFRRQVFTTVGPFVAFPYTAEDQLFNFLIRQHGYQILFDPTVVVKHVNRTAFSVFLRHQRGLGFGSAIARRTVAIKGQIFIRHPHLAYTLPLVRIGRTAGRLLSRNRRAFIRYLLLLPVLLPGYIAWTAGFLAGLHHTLPPRDRLLGWRAGEAVSTAHEHTHREMCGKEP